MSAPARKPRILSLIAAVAANGAIGKDNDLLWHHPLDQKHFRATTMGCPVIMGRRTWDSLPERFRPLPGRRNVVVTRNRDLHAPGAEVVHTLEEALIQTADADKVFVMGGGQLYAAALPLADELVLTEIHTAYNADTFFPQWPRADFDEVFREEHHAAAEGQPGFAFVTYRRRR
ncbi:dihydrofolate reductase [uncultured Aquabacterium sp.]|jgi:dihydrofolate reductase|uniref:dihydrofolate reductase n=1 Tax=uncultured Aquabacterium sp. TaxID=158753 RepID=UPI0026096B05|nr:dihydrofolate reductase [uncultured Aquabacterium sp.]